MNATSGKMADNLGFGDDIPTSLLLTYLQHEFRTTPSYPRHKTVLAILKKNIAVLTQHDRVRDALGVPPKRERSICIGTSLEATREWWNETMKRPRFEASPPETDGNESESESESDATFTETERTITRDSHGLSAIHAGETGELECDGNGGYLFRPTREVKDGGELECDGNGRYVFRHTNSRGCVSVTRTEAEAATLEYAEAFQQQMDEP
jgi:hypothetical protein